MLGLDDAEAVGAVSIRSSSPSTRGGRIAKSPTEVRAPTKLHTASARGARASQSFSVAHSSASKWLNPIQRIVAGSSTVAAASRISSKKPRKLLW